MSEETHFTYQQLEQQVEALLKQVERLEQMADQSCKLSHYFYRKWSKLSRVIDERDRLLLASLREDDATHV